jgi:hypothetical protein
MSKDVFETARKLVDSVEFDCNGVNGKGGNGGLLSDATLKASGACRVALSRAEAPAPVDQVVRDQVTYRMREAACSVLNERGQGNAITIPDVNAIIAAVLRVRTDDHGLTHPGKIVSAEDRPDGIPEDVWHRSTEMMYFVGYSRDRLLVEQVAKAVLEERERKISPADRKVATDTELLDALSSNSWDLRCVSVPTGGDDYDIDWLVIEHHQAPPHERTIAQAYRDDPREAIRRALRETNPNADRCVSCGSVLHDGDSVYYEHGEGGHIHSWCASDDAKSFVDEDEMPLKAGDPIPEPFSYKVEVDQ